MSNSPYNFTFPLSYSAKKDLEKLREIDGKVSAVAYKCYLEKECDWFYSVKSMYGVVRNALKKRSYPPLRSDLDCIFRNLERIEKIFPRRADIKNEELLNLYLIKFFYAKICSDLANRWDQCKRICIFLKPKTMRFFEAWEDIWIKIAEEHPQKTWVHDGAYNPFEYESEKIGVLWSMFFEADWFDAEKIQQHIEELLNRGEIKWEK